MDKRYAMTSVNPQLCDEVQSEESETNNGKRWGSHPTRKICAAVRASVRTAGPLDL